MIYINRYRYTHTHTSQTQTHPTQYSCINPCRYPSRACSVCRCRSMAPGQRRSMEGGTGSTALSWRANRGLELNMESKSCTLL